MRGGFNVDQTTMTEGARRVNAKPQARGQTLRRQRPTRERGSGNARRTHAERQASPAGMEHQRNGQSGRMSLVGRKFVITSISWSN